MSPIRQLGLPVITDASAWHRMLEECRRIAATVGHGDVAFGLGISEAELSNALSERNRNSLKLRQLPYFLRHRGGSDELPRVVAEVCELELATPKPLSAADKLERLESALMRAGTAGAAILADAYGRRR